MFNVKTGSFELLRGSNEVGGIVQTLDQTMPPVALAMVDTKVRKVEDVEKIIEEISAKGRALTITFTDDVIMKYKERYIMGEIYKVLNKTRCVLSFIMVADWSKVGRFHMHGAFCVTDITKITGLRRKLSKYGFTKVVPITNSLRWANYCIKQYTQDGKDGIVIKQDNLLFIHKC